VARRHLPAWLNAVQRARELPDSGLPEVTGTPAVTGPPPAHRWSERDPEAAERLNAARETVAALADEHSVPAENLVPPDAVRRLSWEPPDPLDTGAVAAALAGYGARPWQAALAAEPLTAALRAVAPPPGISP
jgi:ribonuclease D